MLDDWQALNNAPRPFDLVSRNLRELGAISVDRYLSANSADLQVLATNPNYARPLPETSTASPISKPYALVALPAALPHIKQPDAAPTGSPTIRIQHVSRLHHACQRAFGGGTQALKYDFLEENGPKCKSRSSLQ
jgi:hypothetical protein